MNHLGTIGAGSNYDKFMPDINNPTMFIDENHLKIMGNNGRPLTGKGGPEHNMLITPGANGAPHALFNHQM